MRLVNLVMEEMPPYKDYLEAWEIKNRPTIKVIHCNHVSKQLTVKTAINGSKHYWYDCTTCGRRLESIKKSDALKKLNGQIPPDRDTFVDAIKADETNEYNQAKAKASEDANQAYARYYQERARQFWIYHNRYTRTVKWSRLRQQVFERDGHRCQICKTTESLQCHHNTYERLGAELLSDLRTLCATCHINHHIERDMERERERIWLENQLRINQQLSE